MYVSFKHIQPIPFHAYEIKYILFHMHEKGLVVYCMFDCIPRGTCFIPSDNAVRIIDYSTSLYNIPYIALLLLQV